MNRAIRVIDNLLEPSVHQDIYKFLMEPGWGFGAFSHNSPGAPRYWFKHFAGYFSDGEDRDVNIIETELASVRPIQNLWRRLKQDQLSGHTLMRCYANGYPYGTEGGVHKDSLDPTHFTAIYYPHSNWSPNFGGETLFFNADGSDVAACIYPKPNRLVIFPGDIPHVGRGVSRVCPAMRVTLMFKTAWTEALQEPRPVAA